VPLHLTRNEEAIAEILKWMMIATSLQFCVANGATGVANSVSPLLNVFTLYEVDRTVSLSFLQLY
jgi:PiT family inorganic phosphate transporter